MDCQDVSTLSRILSAAAEEFSQKGFRSASLRSIAKKAGVTTGAFYGYFRSKDQLFDALVGSQYRHLIDLYNETLASFHSLPPECQQKDMMTYTMETVSRMTDYIYENLDVFHLILCSSEGTGYENLAHDLAKIDVDATHDFSKTMESAGVAVNSVNPLLEHILTTGMFSAYFELVIHRIPREQADTYIRQLLGFYAAGWQSIMGF